MGSEVYENNFALHLYAGTEIPITHGLSLEARIGDIWELFEDQHLDFQLALSIGKNY